MQPTVSQSSFIMGVTSKHISELMLGTLFKRTFPQLIKSIRVEVPWHCPFPLSWTFKESFEALLICVPHQLTKKNPKAN
jgi:hypothetical protein